MTALTIATALPILSSDCSAYAPILRSDADDLGTLVGFAMPLTPMRRGSAELKVIPAYVSHKSKENYPYTEKDPGSKVYYEAPSSVKIKGDGFAGAVSFTYGFSNAWGFSLFAARAKSDRRVSYDQGGDSEDPGVTGWAGPHSGILDSQGDLIAAAVVFDFAAKLKQMQEAFDANAEPERLQEDPVSSDETMQTQEDSGSPAESKQARKDRALAAKKQAVRKVRAEDPDLPDYLSSPVTNVGCPFMFGLGYLSEEGALESDFTFGRYPPSIANLERFTRIGHAGRSRQAYKYRHQVTFFGLTPQLTFRHKYRFSLVTAIFNGPSERVSITTTDVTTGESSTRTGSWTRTGAAWGFDFNYLPWNLGISWMPDIEGDSSLMTLKWAKTWGGASGGR